MTFNLLGPLLIQIMVADLQALDHKAGSYTTGLGGDQG